MAGDRLHLQCGPNDTAMATVQALTRLQVALIPREDLFALASRYPQIAAALWADSGANASILSEWLLGVGRRKAKSRVAHLICETPVRQRNSPEYFGGDEYAWPMTQEQLGDATGLTAVHVNRTIHGLRREGLLNHSHQRISVLDWGGLCDSGDFTPDYLHFREREYAAPIAALC
ncbi:Crp/Fnr family transcriptional regulator [Sphingomonas sp. G-3-2-10]|uniref:Crp/Fnr family transcriptional regulator n=1 Tax=Sphingomonas sp. G-3-2-10 TaxID=2728838 RepID=UPI00146A511C|nr:Crp/Fnr family transcriptional regulator [Sphingomonas sp. G-3-2-10]NML07990.1 Crp/Fnr family transcriptional regulator [Sphingomonas sp. G-3-2-10]